MNRRLVIAVKAGPTFSYEYRKRIVESAIIHSHQDSPASFLRIAVLLHMFGTHVCDDFKKHLQLRFIAIYCTSIPFSNDKFIKLRIGCRHVLLHTRNSTVLDHALSTMSIMSQKRVLCHALHRPCTSLL